MTDSENSNCEKLNEAEPSNKVYTIPNIISMVRLVMSFIVFGMLYVGGLWVIATVLFIIAVLSDALDGYIARKYNQISILGRMLDPFVDKIIVCGCFIFLQNIEGTGVCPWVTVIIIGREMLITTLRGYLEKQGIDFSAMWSGKLKMVIQSIAIPFCILAMAEGFSNSASFLLMRDIALYGAVLITIYSGIDYFRHGIKELNQRHPPAP